MYKLGFYNFIDLFLPWIKNPNAKRGVRLEAYFFGRIVEIENNSTITEENQKTWLKSKISFYGRD
jgi:hypothetical protein